MIRFVRRVIVIAVLLLIAYGLLLRLNPTGAKKLRYELSNFKMPEVISQQFKIKNIKTMTGEVGQEDNIDKDSQKRKINTAKTLNTIPDSMIPVPKGKSTTTTTTTIKGKATTDSGRDQAFDRQKYAENVEEDTTSSINTQLQPKQEVLNEEIIPTELSEKDKKEIEDLINSLIQ